MSRYALFCVQSYILFIQGSLCSEYQKHNRRNVFVGVLITYWESSAVYLQNEKKCSSIFWQFKIITRNCVSYSPDIRQGLQGVRMSFGDHGNSSSDQMHLSLKSPIFVMLMFEMYDNYIELRSQQPSVPEKLLYVYIIYILYNSDTIFLYLKHIHTNCNTKYKINSTLLPVPGVMP